MFEIMPNLFLSSFQDVAVTPDTFVVNCTKDLPMKSPNGIRIAVDDDMSRESSLVMLKALPGAVKEIDRQLHVHKRRVVVHCQAGQQRSPTVVAAYLICKYGYDLDRAIQYIKSKKRDAFFYQVNFRDSLEKFCSA